MQFALRLVLFPQLRSIDASKPRPLHVPLCFPPLLVFTGHKSAEASFQRRFRQLAINRTRFDVYQRAIAVLAYYVAITLLALVSRWLS
jgi:hypothetical protein